MDTYVEFMETGAGRLVRIVFGFALIVVGLLIMATMGAAASPAGRSAASPTAWYTGGPPRCR
jgi:hypothetical protein